LGTIDSESKQKPKKESKKHDKNETPLWCFFSDCLRYTSESKYREIGLQHFTTSHIGLINICTHVSPDMKDLSSVVIRHHPGRCELFFQKQAHALCAHPNHLAWGCSACNARDKRARKHIENYFHNFFLVQNENYLSLQSLSLQFLKAKIDLEINKFLEKENAPTLEKTETNR
jgi:hypothetical protein